MKLKITQGGHEYEFEADREAFRVWVTSASPDGRTVAPGATIPVRLEPLLPVPAPEPRDEFYGLPY